MVNLVIDRLRTDDNGLFVFADVITQLGHNLTSANNRWYKISSEYKTFSKVDTVKREVRTLTREGLIEYLAFSREAQALVHLFNSQF